MRDKEKLFVLTIVLLSIFTMIIVFLQKEIIVAVFAGLSIIWLALSSLIYNFFREREDFIGSLAVCGISIFLFMFIFIIITISFPLADIIFALAGALNPPLVMIILSHDLSFLKDCNIMNIIKI